ncbi:hypothetical protein D0C36_15925 [Mucilaginibacter conchicola]|uniref:Thiopeptide-type bacteriocin biosynthesis domain-containing protein n=1 Tax=Mucilaginibacter conchicola TaxID=2303333 RepID=A0A372NUE6_9SPHI|nr:lantibiotic dehydratase [Mucilaginibacter conchicola]RFZ92878.1 hypothetical protein D0C36_15925 [Mucilaginibacter conchicola]
MSAYRFFDRLMLRAPVYSFSRYAPERLGEVLGNREFREAVLLATEGLYRALEAAGFDPEKLSANARWSLLRYYNRMCFRPTPFGAFASVGMTSWGDGSCRISPAMHLHRLHSREVIYGRVSDGRVLAGSDRVGLSPLAYRYGKEFRCYRLELSEADGRYSFHLDAVAAEGLTVRLFRRLAKGPEAFDGLSACIRKLSGCDPEEASGFIGFLLHAQLLQRYAPERSLIGGQETELTDNENGSTDYAVLNSEVTGGPSVEDRAGLERALAALRIMAACAGAAEGALEKFSRAFSDRFGDRQVPLTEALDPDAGISYPETGQAVPEVWTLLHKFFLAKWIQERSRGFYDVLVLSEADLAGLANEQPSVNFPPTTGVLFRKVQEGMVIEHAGGATGTALAGRFSLFSDEAYALCREAAAMEAAAHPDVVFADIRGECGPHTDNINRRRRVYGYEIALDGCINGDKVELLPSELLLSVQDGELVLYSLSLKKRVVPRLSTAFNQNRHGLGMFRFLADLQYQGLCTRLLPDLEVLFPGLAFYPRLTYEKCVLAAAKWKFRSEELPVDVSGMYVFRKRHHLPARVSMGYADRQLVFDLTDHAEALFFLQCIAEKAEVTLTEWLVPDKSVRCGYREMSGQYLAVGWHDSVVYKGMRKDHRKTGTKVTRRFLPGSEWLYIKLYCSEASADRILLGVVRPLLNKFRGELLSWFFIRYKDPEPHIRLRFRVKGEGHGRILAALDRLTRSGEAAGLVQVVQVTAYERELERYSPELITLAEGVFEAGSDLVLIALENEAEVMPLAVVVIYGMLEAFLKGYDDCIAFAGRSAGAFRTEFSIDKQQQLAIDKAFRKLRGKLENALSSKSVSDTAGFLYERIRIINKAVVGVNKVTKMRLLSDLCHMQVNRFFSSDQRPKELEVWSFTEKYIKGEMAKFINRNKEV